MYIKHYSMPLCNWRVRGHTVSLVEPIALDDSASDWKFVRKIFARLFFFVVAISSSQTEAMKSNFLRRD